MLKKLRGKSSLSIIFSILSFGAAIPAFASQPITLTAVQLSGDVPLAQPGGSTVRLTTRSQLAPSGAQIDRMAFASDGRTLMLYAGGVSAELGALSNPSNMDGSSIVGADGRSIARVRRVSSGWSESGNLNGSTTCSDGKTPQDQIGITHDSTDGYEIDFDGGQGSLSFDVLASQSHHTKTSACP